MKCAVIVDNACICVGDGAGARGICNDSGNSIKDDVRIGDGAKVSNRTGVDDRATNSIKNGAVVGNCTASIVVDGAVINDLVIVGDERIVLDGSCVVKGFGIGYGTVIGDGTRKIVERPRIVDVDRVKDGAGVV